MQRLLLSAVALLVVSQSRAMADDWPNWFGPTHDAVWRESGLTDQFAEAGPPVAWRTEVNAGYSGPAVAGGRVYLTDRTTRKRAEDEDKRTVYGTERVLCLSVDSGEILWKHEYDCGYRISYPAGPRTTPVIDGNRVYTLGAMGDLICFKAESGDVIWSRQLTKDYELKSAPVWGFSIHPRVDGERLICGVGGEGSGLVAFNKLTGEEIWRSLTVDEIGYAPPVFMEHEGQRQLIFWYDKAVAGVDPKTGKELWAQQFPRGETIPNQPTTSIATPRQIGNKLLLSTFYYGSMLLEVSFDTPGARVVWDSPYEYTEVRFSKNNDHIRDLNSLMTTPVVRDGHIYGVSGNGEFRCLTLDSQEMKWGDFGPIDGKEAMFGTCFIVENEDRYYIMNDQGELMIARLSPAGFEQLARAKILEPTAVARGRKIVWSHPAFANGHMFARNDKELVCVDLRASSNKGAETTNGGQ